MSAGWWGIVAVLVAGVALVLYGALADRRRTRKQVEALTSPPARAIPGLPAAAATPAYLTELQARTRPTGAPNLALDDATRTNLKQALADTPGIDAGIPRDVFVTDPATGWAVADEPLVAVCADEIATLREILPLLEHARTASRPLVLVAPGFAAVVLDTLAANAVQGLLRCVPVTADDEQRAEVVRLTGATELTRTDLRSGWHPETAWGRCPVWVATRRNSWTPLGLK